MAELADPAALEDAARHLVEAALKAGADAADAVAQRGISASATVRAGRIEDLSRSEGDGFGLRVFIGKKTASISVNALAGVDELVDRAVAMARLAPPDPFVGLADPALFARSFPDLDLYDPELPGTDTLVDEARALEEIARGVAGVTTSEGATSGWSMGAYAIATSNGFTGSARSTRFGRSVSAIAGEGTRMQSDHDGTGARHRGDLDPLEKTGRTAGERAVARLDPRVVATGRAAVVFDRRIATSMLGHLAGAINGASIARGTSFLKSHLGRQLFPKGFVVTDDPLRRRGHASRPFDGEGLASLPIRVIDDGVLTQWLLDTASANELGLVSNGRAARGLGTPMPSTTNFTMAAGEAPPDDLIRSVGTGLFVTDFIGHGVNQVTGDYSRGASGFWIENGEKAYPVSEITIAGNLIEMFGRIVPADDLEFRTAYAAPTIAIDGLTIAGR